MIISHKHKFIFFAVPKTGTHTIRKVLREHLDEDDWEQENLFNKVRLPIPAMAQLNHGHISVTQIKGHLNPQIWANYYKFAFVRNPYERYISTCSFLIRNHPKKEHIKIPFINSAINNSTFKQRILVQTQTSLLKDETSAIGLDYVGRFEMLQASMDEVMKTLGLQKVELSKTNKSDHLEFDHYANDELREKVNDFYLNDFKNFNYEMT